MRNELEQLLQFSEPAIRYKAALSVLGEDEAYPTLKALQREILRSPLVRRLISEQDHSGQIPGTSTRNRAAHTGCWRAWGCLLAADEGSGLRRVVG